MNPLRKAILGGAVLASTFGGGVLGAAYLTGTASAADSTTTTAPATAAAPTQAPPQGYGQGQGQRPQGPPDWSKGGHQANGKTETVLTGDDLAKVKAAAEAAVPGATVQRAETDADGDEYEAHMTKADGSIVTVKLDSSFNVTKTADGMG